MLQPYSNSKLLKRHLALDPKSPLSDQERYNYLVQFVIKFLTETGKLDGYLLDHDTFYQKLETLLTKNYPVVESDFKKSMNSVKSRWIDLIKNELTEEQTGDDDQDAVTETNETVGLIHTIKPYGDDFLSLLPVQQSEVYYWHVPMVDHIADHQTMIDLVKGQILKDKFVFSLLISDTELYVMTEKQPDDEQNNCWTTGERVNDFISRLSHPNGTISLNPVHQISLDTLKRNLMNGDLQSFSENLSLMSVYTNFYFSRGMYLRNETDFDGYDGDLLGNVVKSFPTGFEELAKRCIANFVFNGQTGKVKLVSYWLSTEPMEKIMDKFDYDQFTWEPITQPELVKGFSISGEIGHSILH